jgi:superfamily II DNA helicase RecQ
MRDYATASECRMRFLRDALDDDNVSACGRCDNCTDDRYDSKTDPNLIAQALTFIRRAADHHRAPQEMGRAPVRDDHESCRAGPGTVLPNRPEMTNFLTLSAMAGS